MPSLPADPRRRRIAAIVAVSIACITPFSIGNAQSNEVAIEGVREARRQSVDGEMLLIDIRRPQEWLESGIPDVAVELDMQSSDFMPRLQALLTENPDKRIGLICAVGSRSRYLADWLSQRGVKNVVNVSAGVHGRNGWLANELPVRKPGRP